MGLPTGADAATVRKAYLALVRQHHPDLNPGNKESENFIKILNQGWEILSNPGKKEMYDALLYNHYQRASRKEQSGAGSSREQGESRSQRASRIRAERDARYVADFGRKQAFFRFQLVLCILFAIGAPFYAFNNWFVDFESYDHMRLLLAAILFGTSIFRLIILAFRYFNVYNILHPENPKNDAVIYGSLLLSLFVIPILLFQAGDWRKDYHLNHYASETDARITYRNGLFVIYDFEAGGETITKNVTLTDQFYSMDSLVQAAGKLRIRYSTKDPRITEEITWILNPFMP